MNNNVKKSFTGYIEGYYGKLLNWHERKRIIKKLKEINFSYYLYAPKEDVFHRRNWRENYPRTWLDKFQKLCTYAKKNNVSIIAGISPGIDFNFKKENLRKELKLLVKKIKLFQSYGASEIAILFDDIPKNQSLKENGVITDGLYHSRIINLLGNLLKINFFVVPKIYAFELQNKDDLYIYNFFKYINNCHKILFCGKKIIAKKHYDFEIPIDCKNEIIYWDNIYANDYCPRKLMIGPWKYRKNLPNIMINPTGLIETDLFILDIMFFTKLTKSSKKGWEIACLNHKLPCYFCLIENFFYPYKNNSNKQLNYLNYGKINFALDKLLWEWNTSLSREWYIFLFCAKQDLKILEKKSNSTYIRKSQNYFLSSYILNKNSKSQL